jgi:hypothetical protein
MNRTLIVIGLTLFLVAQTPRHAVSDDPVPIKYGIWSGKQSVLSVAGGEVFLSNRHPTKWQIDETRKGTTVRLGSNDKWDGWYLSCDPKGKKKTVFLSKKLTAGSYWSPVSIESPHPGSITANAGKLKDWHLDTGQAVKRKDKDGEAYTAHRVVLTKEPKRILKFYIYPVAP